ncbi:MAG: MFS transporter [Deltaproteobacteria bacterium RBG_13_49_15]|nr:MAG: MFS transporter [Deltaproteobacteria bacterium RBG_13_49_15]
MIADSLEKRTWYRWFIFWILAFGYVLVYFHRLCPAVVAVDMMRDLSAGGALTGFLGAAYFYPYALMQLPAGLLSDSWGPRKTITLFFILAFGGSVLLGLAPSVFWAIVGRTAVGFGVAMLFVPAMKILAVWFTKKEFGFMTGILMAMGGIGSLIAATPLALLSAWIGWRFSFVVVGIFTLVLAALVWSLVRDKPSIGSTTSPSGDPPSGQISLTLMEGVRRVIALPAFWPIAIWFFFDCAVFFAFGGLWGGPYLMHVYKMSRNDAGRILSMLAIGMIIGSPLLSYVSGSLLRARKPVIVISSFIVLILSGFLAFLTGRISILGLYGICFGLGVFSSAIVVIGFTANKELFPVQIAGTATGLVNLFPFAGGAVFQPFLGYILERYPSSGGMFSVEGYQAAFAVLFICSAIAFLSSLFMKETMSAEAA